MDAQDISKMLTDLESDRVERTISTTNTDKFAEAICAFANDFPNNRISGYLIIGANDETGQPNGLHVTDELLQRLGALRSDGKYTTASRYCRSESRSWRQFRACGCGGATIRLAASSV